MSNRRLLACCTLVSLLLHTSVIYLYQALYTNPTQLPLVRRFSHAVATPAQRFGGAASPNLQQVHMERLATGGQPLEAPEIAAERIPTPGVTPDEAPLSARPPDKEGKLLPPPNDEEEMRPSLEAGPMAAYDEFSLDLIDLATLAQSERFKAAIVVGQDSLQRPEGFINFTHLLLDGTTDNYRIEDLARYMRDHTSIIARARGVAVRGFSSDTLLEDPIHFLFPGPLRGRASSEERIFLNQGDSERLGRYLRGGGFLFVDAGDGPDDHWFLKEALRQIRRALQNRGQVFEIPLDHPVYRAYYAYEDGFPSENKRAVTRFPIGLGNAWYYPERTPCMGTLRGLWGVETPEGQLVALLSDLDMRRRWVGEPLANGACQTEEESPEGAGGEEGAAGEEQIARLPYLQAATNVVVYALMRPGGLAVKLAPFAWQQRAPIEERGRRP